jgi:hypothetical protein
MSARDPLIQAERRCKARYLDRSRWDLFPCRGSVVPCRTLSLVSVTRDGTVKPGFPKTYRLRKEGLETLTPASAAVAASFNGLIERAQNSMPNSTASLKRASD